MNDQDLRDCFAMFAMLGWAMNGDYHEDEIPTKAYRLADAMLEARDNKSTIGLPPMRRKTRSK
jgi:hypothetical protein